MAESSISVAIITIACVIAATMLATTMIPAANLAASAAVSTTVGLADRIETSVEIIAETNSTPEHVHVWVKNTGQNQLAAAEIKSSSIFFGPVDNFRWIPFNSTLAIAPSWKYIIENDTDGYARWDTGETVNITIRWREHEPLAPGSYFFNIVLHNAVSDEVTFSI